MDNNNYNQFNGQPQQPYGQPQQPYGQPYGQPQQFGGQPYGQPQAKAKTKFGKGMAMGILFGILFTILIGFVYVKIQTGLFGRYMVLGGKHANVQSQTDILDDATVKKLEEVQSYIDLYFNNEVDEAELKNSMIDGLVEGLGDPYSTYYTAEEYKDLQATTSGSYYGIGAGLQQDPDTMVVTVTKIYAGTPSEEAGMKKDDIITYVDGVDATTKELTDLVQNIRGEEGTTVNIKVYRPSTKEELEFNVERRNVELPSIEAKMLDDKIGYIQISEFQGNTAEQFKKNLDELQKQGMKSLVVDLRDNPGGLLSSVAEILDTILPEGTLVYTEDKYGERNYLTSEASCLDIPMTVLVNGNSASASEIFAGAIKDYKYGTLIGTQTFGKGIVQTIFPLKDGDALKVTTAKYYTPNGNYIHGVGIEPDIVLEYEYSGDTNADYDMQYDNQLQKAIEVLNEAMSK